MRELTLCDVDVQDDDIPTAFDAPTGLRLVLREPIEARSQEGSKPCLRRIVRFEVLLLERDGEESLRKILRFVDCRVPLEAQILVDRLPVERRETLVRPTSYSGVLVDEIGDER